jgi:glucosamine kinase
MHEPPYHQKHEFGEEASLHAERSDGVGALSGACGAPRPGDDEGPFKSFAPLGWGGGAAQNVATPLVGVVAGTQIISGREPYVVGVDGGGTKTLAVVVDAQGNERGRGIAGSANYAAVGINQAVHHIRSAVEEAVQMAGCSLPLQAAWLGLAGIDRPADYNILFPHLQSLAEVVRLTNDAELVLSALDDAVGIALIAGTGSIALVRDAHGTVARTGGWGHIIGDEGSGYDIGHQCLQAVSRAVDGRGQQTSLVELLLNHWNLNSASDIIGKVYPGGDKATIASLSTLVFTAARDGDEVAGRIVQGAANELALAAVTVRSKLDLPGEQVSIALGGGLLLHQADFRAQVLQEIGKQLSIGQAVLVEEPALSGARAAVKMILPGTGGGFSEGRCRTP